MVSLRVFEVIFQKLFEAVSTIQQPAGNERHYIQSTCLHFKFELYNVIK